MSTSSPSQESRPPLRTDMGEDRVSSTANLAPHNYQLPLSGEARGTYGGRPLIGHDTRINGGVYLGASAREAIVVDDSKGLLGTGYTNLKVAVLDRQPRRKRDFIPFALQQTYEYTRQLLPYNEDAVQELTESYTPDTKISITKFIEAGAGVCRHQALLSGYFIEKMIDDGLLPGEVHVERNQDKNGVAHAWVRYSPSLEDQAFIIDPAQNFVGTQEEAAQSGRWDYTVPQ